MKMQQRCRRNDRLLLPTRCTFRYVPLTMLSVDVQVGAGPAGNGEDAAAQHAAWLARQLAAFEQRLLGLLAAPSAVLQVRRLAECGNGGFAGNASRQQWHRKCRDKLRMPRCCAAAAYPLGRQSDIADPQAQSH